MYAVAYSDQNGDFAENEPYIEDATSKENAFYIRNNLSKQGLKNIMVFQYPGSYHSKTPEILTWDYIKEREINE